MKKLYRKPAITTLARNIEHWKPTIENCALGCSECGFLRDGVAAEPYCGLVESEGKGTVTIEALNVCPFTFEVEAEGVPV